MKIGISKVADTITEKIGTGLDNITIVDNFANDIDLNRLTDFCLASEIFPNPNRSYTLNLTDDIRSLQEQYSKMMIDHSSSKYADRSPIRQYDMTDKKYLASFLAYPEGSFLHPHIDIVGLVQDDGDEIENPMDKWTGHLASILYLNDNYDGGEIYFPDRDLEIKPKAGTLIVFPGNKHYVHGVRPVSRGTRFTLSMWIRFAEAIGNDQYSAGVEK